uniref:Alpha/beta hydrolase fold-3 domain-containing protein n=1 Tax=Chrysotila carterae TaxID=13221 RepID=A0A7S4BWS1_CHRCT
MSGARSLYQTCVAWSGPSYWWQLDPILALSKHGIDTYYAAMLTARKIVRAARLPEAAAYAIALPLIGWFSPRPASTASIVYQFWCNPDVVELQAVFAPLRWRYSVSLVHRLVGSDILREERSINGNRVVLLQRRSTAEAMADAVSDGDNDEEPERPTVMFVPGGAFISDFEAADLFFLYRWVRETDVLLVYASYDFAPQAPYPLPMMCVLRTYRALREHTHGLGFRASPLVVASLSAGCNLALSAVLAPLLHKRAPPEIAHELRVESLMPHAMLLLCPVVNICRSPSPSRISFASDVLLPMPLLRAFGAAYDQESDHWMERDPLLSPVFASDDVLRRLPPTHIQCGGLDPLLDDSVDFNTRIRRVHVPGELTIFRSLPHTFVSFPHWHAMPEVESAMRQSCALLRELCAPKFKRVALH